MLERERNEVFGSLHRPRKRIAGEPFPDYNLDAAKFVCRVPVVLVQQFSAERRKSKRLTLARFSQLYRKFPVSLELQDSTNREGSYRRIGLSQPAINRHARNS